MPVSNGVRKRTRLSSVSPGALCSQLQTTTEKLNIVHVDPAKLQGPKRQLRKHSKRQIAILQASLIENGFIKPIIVDANGVIVAGYGVWTAARSLKLPTVPVIYIDHLTEEQLRLYAITDNQTATLGTWDDNLLRLELGELINLDLKLDLNLNFDATGFPTAEIDNLLMGTAPFDGEGAPAVQAVAITTLGDLWRLGDQIILCGNSLEEASYLRLLGDERAQLIVSENPYNLSASTIGGMGKHKHANFAFASGEMSSEEFTAFLAAIFRWLIQYSVDGSIHYQFIDWRHLREMLTAGSQYHELKNMVVWAKTNAGLGSFYRSQHELIFVYQNGGAKPINNFLLGETGRWRSNLWVHAGCNTFRAGRDEDLAAHGTVKPLSLIADAIRDCSKRGGIVLDPFGGSGVTLLAAEKTGRRARLIEIDPLYVDVTIRRWKEQTGKQAILAETGATFAEVRDARLGTEEEGSDDE